MRTAAFLVVVLSSAMQGCTQGKPATDVGMPDVRNFGEVDPGRLYRAARCDAAGIDELVNRYGIRTVVNLDAKDDVCDGIHRNALNYYRFPSNAMGQSRKQMKQFLRLMADAREGRASDVLPVYVHCNRGADRTGEAVAAYRIVFQNWTPQQAMDELRQYDYWQGFHEPKKFLANLKPGDESVIEDIASPAPAECDQR